MAISKTKPFGIVTTWTLLEVDEEVVLMPPNDDLDSTVGDIGMVKSHRFARAKWVGSILVRVEPQEFEAIFGGMEVE